MTTILTIIGGIITALMLIIGFACVIFVFHYLSWFHWHKCQYCNHNMVYKGFKEDDSDGHYLFYCPKCGAWDQISRHEFLRDENESNHDL